MEISKNVCGLAQQVTGPTVRKRTPFLASKLLRNSKVTNCRKKRLSWHPRKKKATRTKRKKFSQTIQSSSVQGKIIGKWNWILSRAITPPAKFELFVSFILISQVKGDVLNGCGLTCLLIRSTALNFKSPTEPSKKNEDKQSIKYHLILLLSLFWLQICRSNCAELQR